MSPNISESNVKIEFGIQCQRIFPYKTIINNSVLNVNLNNSIECQTNLNVQRQSINKWQTLS